jgi:hypothetical protein
MQKMIWTPSESAGANSETPNHAFAHVVDACSRQVVEMASRERDRKELW